MKVDTASVGKRVNAMLVRRRMREWIDCDSLLAPLAARSIEIAKAYRREERRRRSGLRAVPNRASAPSRGYIEFHVCMCVDVCKCLLYSPSSLLLLSNEASSGSGQRITIYSELNCAYCMCK